MQVFTDNKNRSWTISINVGMVRRVKAMLCVDLMDALSAGFMRKLSLDPAILGNLLFVLCEREACSRGLSDRKFAAALSGDSGLSAFKAFFTELISFFPSGEKTDNSGRHEQSDKPHCSADDCWTLVWTYAGVLGVDPSPFTLRELSTMAKARRRDEWSRTSLIVSKLHNVWCRPKLSPDHFNPYSEKNKISAKSSKPIKHTKLAFRIMKKVFGRKK